VAGQVTADGGGGGGRRGAERAAAGGRTQQGYHDQSLPSEMNSKRSGQSWRGSRRPAGASKDAMSISHAPADGQIDAAAQGRGNQRGLADFHQIPKQELILQDLKAGRKSRGMMYGRGTLEIMATNHFSGSSA